MLFGNSRRIDMLKKFINFAIILAKGDGVGIVLGIDLNYSYKELRFIPLYPVLEAGTVLAWKKEQVFTSATSTFLSFARKFRKVISDDKI